MTQPPDPVLAAFGCRVTPVPLRGGRGTAWRAGDLVLRPLDMTEAELEWQAATLGGLDISGVRIAVPVRARSGALVVDGWTATAWLEGSHQPRWEQVIAAGERFHAGLAGLPRPDAILDARTHHWARADRIVWDESALTEPVSEPVRRLLGARSPVDLPNQLIHGDLTGNVLLSTTAPPAIIDFSPYYRPAAYASAIVAVDARVWHGASPGLVAQIRSTPDGEQLLIRAVSFRLLSDSDAPPDGGQYADLIAALIGVLDR